MPIWIEPGQALPAPGEVDEEPPGLIAIGRDLSARRLLEAYRKGLFPWFSDGQPVLWWSPDPRMVLRVADFRRHRSLRQRIRKMRREGRWRVTLNGAFDAVIAACAAQRADREGTWITPAIVESYRALHRMGHAHSVELWCDDGDPPTLAGGLYGVGIGRMFFGESMFSRADDASKVALACLVALLREAEMPVIDCQQNTTHLASLGAAEVGRAEFLREVERLVALPAPVWRFTSLALPDE